MFFVYVLMDVIKWIFDNIMVKVIVINKEYKCCFYKEIFIIIIEYLFLFLLCIC